MKSGFFIAVLAWASLPVTALSQQPLAVNCPTNHAVWTCGTNAVVVYPAPTASGGNCGETNVVRCVPSSGSRFPLGPTTVVCTVTNTCGERDSCSFTVTVDRDTTPPVITCPSNIIVRACGTNRAVVNYPAPTAIDDQDRDPTIACMPPSGSVFPAGETTVRCVATDDCTNSSQCAFTVRVPLDETPPFIECPESIDVCTCGPNAVPVTYPPIVAMDNLDPAPTLVCDPPSGSLFPIGTTTVRCVATDHCGNRSECMIAINVIQDTNAPSIDCLSSLTGWTCNPNGTTMTFPEPEVSDGCDPSPTVICVPPSGGTFPIGTTMVQCTAEDDCENRALCGFTVTVILDATPPLIQCNSNVVVSTCDADGAVVRYDDPVTSDDCDDHPSIFCFPPSGRLFPIGETTVICGGEDNCGHRSTCTFTVTVRPETTLPGIDLDDDGMGDIWQIRFQTGSIDLNGDLDDDGHSNAAEAGAGTNPRDARSRFELTSIRRDPARNELELTLAGVESKRYQAQVAPDLGGVWYDVGPPALGLPTLIIVIAMDDPGRPFLASNAFFRVQVQDIDQDRDGVTAWEEAILGTSDLTPNTRGTPGGDHGAAQQYADLNGGGAGLLREVAAAHVGGTPEVPPALFVTAAGTGGYYKLSSWRVNALQPLHLQDTPQIEGRRVKLHTLTPPTSPGLSLHLVVNARIREDNNLFLTVYRVSEDGTFTGLDTLGFGSSSSASVIEYAMAHRPITGSTIGTVESFQLVTPIIAKNTAGQLHLRIVTWSVHPVSGALTAMYDTDNLGHTDVPLDGGSLQIRYLDESKYVVAYSNTNNLLSQWFFSVDDAGVVFPRGGEISGLPIRGGTNVVETTAIQFALESLNSHGFLTGFFGDSCKMKLAVWEERVVAFDGGSFSRPFYITDNTVDQSPAAPGVALYLPKLTNGRSELFGNDRNFGGALAYADFDGDGYGDIAIGVPGEPANTLPNAGAVIVMYGSHAGLAGTSKDQFWTQGSMGIQGQAETNDLFGYALAAGDFNGDSWADLAIGVPGEDVEDNFFINAGAVNVLYGGPGGLTDAGNKLFIQGTDGLVNSPGHEDWFGNALAAGDFNGDGVDDLAVGVPHERVDLVENAGAVHIVYGTNVLGLTAGAGPGNHLIHQNSTNMHDSAHPHDWFGSVLAAGKFDDNDYEDLVVGIPLEDVNGVVNAGAVQVVYGAVNGLGASSQFISQHVLLPGGADVPGVPEEQDHFGSAVVAGDFDGDGIDELAIGVPDEDVENNTLEDAGAVHVFRGTAEGLNLGDHRLITQNSFQIGSQPSSSDIKGVAENNDRFGRALTAGYFDDDTRMDLAIGAPNESVDNNTITSAGIVHVLYGSLFGLTTTSNQLVRQGADGIRDQPEPYDAFGTVLAAGNLSGDLRDDLIVGSPNEDADDENDNNGAKPNAGVVQVLYGSDLGITDFGDDLWWQGAETKIRALLTDAQWEQTYGIIGSGKLFEQMPSNEPTNVHTASVTKVMTLLLTVEALLDPTSGIGLNDIVEISEAAADVDGSHMEPKLVPGDLMPLDLLMRGMIVSSCNKASRAIGEHVGSSYPGGGGAFDKFVARMNAKADELKMVNTEYSHPAHGGVTTPQDLVTLWLFAWQYPLFQEYAGQYPYPGNDLCGETPVLDDGMIIGYVDKCYEWDRQPFYPGLEGWKAGFGGISVANFDRDRCTGCFLAQATRLARSLVVGMQQSGDSEGDTKRLFDYGYQLLFTPDHRGGHQMAGPAVKDFAVRRITDSLSFTAMVDTQNRLWVHTWQVEVGAGNVSPHGSVSLTYDDLAAGTHAVPSTLLDLTLLPTGGESEADYLTGHLEAGRLRLDVWRLGADPGP